MHVCAYNYSVNFEWDCQKAASNIKKHGIAFAEAAMVFYDESAITIQDAALGEERFITLGMDSLARVDCVRIISARKATPGERREYGSYV
jgi:uncharacterized DUF497 family protein